MTGLGEILDQFEQALELERELGTRTLDVDRALLSASLAPVPPAKIAPAVSAPAAAPVPPPPPPPAPVPAAPVAAAAETGAARPDFAFLLECDPTGAVAELLPKMSAAIGYGPDGVKVNDPTARVLIVLGSDALRTWLPGVKAVPGQWVMRGTTPALVTASPTKTYRFFAHDAAKITLLKRRLWQDLKAALSRLGKAPPRR